MRLRPWVPFVLVLAGAAPALGATAGLVKDINPFPRSDSSQPKELVQVGNLSYFAADDGETGEELWRTDGTEAGTFRVLDACPGECSGFPRRLAVDGDRYFFRVLEPGGLTLWVTAGTPATTFRLSEELRPGNDPILGGASGGVVYFPADDGVHGLELWRTDGTPAGTFMVADIRPGPVGSEPSGMTAFGGRIFFRANDGRGGSLWKSDGTARGTQLVRDPLPRSNVHAGPASLQATSRALFFVAPVPGKDTFQLWKSDGTARGTAPLTNFTTERGRTAILDSVVLKDRLFFIGDSVKNGQELWVSDGTPAGTVALTRFTERNAFLENVGAQLPRSLVGGRLIFRANDGPRGRELWSTDGTPRGTRIVRDICPGACNGTGAIDLLPQGGRLFFGGYDDAGGYEPWVTDGTAAGTVRARDILRGNASSFPQSFRSVGGGAFFQAQGQIWHTNGTPRGTVRLTSLGPNAVDLGNASLLGNVLIFAAEDTPHGIELWRSDGTPEGTRLLLDINDADLGGSFPGSFMTLGGQLYFFANDGERGYELWRSDGTDGGTVLVHEFRPEGEPLDRPTLYGWAEAGGRLFFLSDAGGQFISLWTTDGTSAGTRRLDPEGFQTVLTEVRAVGSSVFFAGRDAEHGSELWASDGTVAGTRRVADLVPGEWGSGPRDFTAFQGQLYFTAETDLEGRELWRTDGTEAGTALVKDIHTVPFESGNPLFLTGFAGRLWFFAEDGSGGPELWSTDGTTAGTLPTIEIEPGPGIFSVTRAVVAGSRLYIFGGGPSGSGLWVTDGTQAGTRKVAEVFFENDPFETPVLYNGELYFSAANALSDRALWKTDGTEAGTVEVLDAGGEPVTGARSLRVLAGRLYFTVLGGGGLYQSDGTPAGTVKILDLPPIFESNVDVLTPAAGRLFFSRRDPAVGVELWAVEP